MKTAIKVVVSLLILGVILAVIGLIVIDFDFANISSYFKTDKDYTVTQTSSEYAATGIVIESDNRIVKLIPSTDAKYSIKYYQSEYDKVTYTEADGVIRIKAKMEKRKWWLNLGRTSNEVRTILIGVPTSFEGTIDVETSNGDVTADNLGELQRLSLESSNGDITAKSMNVDGAVTLNSSNGDISISVLSSSAKVYARTTNGEITIDALSAAETTMHSSNGDIEISGINCSNIEATSSNGEVEITLFGEQSDYEIEVETSTGSITLDGIKISDQTLNGGAAKRLKAITSNGSIEIDFI
ncbi:MAG: DUF4097 family beta strand repeat-containing protein [Clostridia bacterium]|nr:DUF4097 family beta strand repeat-containing protein [Clostridia bacterium]